MSADNVNWQAGEKVNHPLPFPVGNITSVAYTSDPIPGVTIKGRTLMGTPTKAGKYRAEVKGSGPDGCDTRQITIEVVDGKPGFNVQLDGIEGSLIEEAHERIARLEEDKRVMWKILGDSARRILAHLDAK